MKRCLTLMVLVLLAASMAAGLFPRAAHSSPLPPSPKTIRVVMDDKYPPYAFRDGGGRLQGILVDRWRLWEERTGIRAEIHAMDWQEALRRFQAGEFAIIDTIFRNGPRERLFAFSKPYARVEVPAFFQKNVSGITDASSLKEFPVAVKNGDAAVDFLLGRGVNRLVGYDSYEEILRAAQEHKVGVFVMDKPPAMYFLYKMGIQKQFQLSKPLYIGEFHRAVRKGSEPLLETVEGGFARLSPRELEEIDRNWLGAAAASGTLLRPLFLGILVGLVPVLALTGWNRALRKSVERKTIDLKKEMMLTSAQADRLRASEENYRMVVENAGVCILITRNGRILFANPQLSRVLGIPQEELAGRGFEDLVHPEDRERVVGYHVKRMRGEEAPERYECRVVSASGQIVSIDTNVVSITWEGQKAVLSFLRDVTRQKKLEDQLAQYRKMEAVGRLAGGIAHDYNNLLAVIVGYANLLLTRPGNGSPFTKEINEIRRAAERAADLTRQILAFSRKQLLQPKIVSLNDIVRNMTGTLRCLISDGIELSSCLEHGLPPVLVDPGQVQQVILNLAINARDAMPQGGRLIIGTKAVDRTEPAIQDHPHLMPGRYIELFVSDTGVGIEKGIIPKIFEPFFTTKAQGKGSGLGLATVEGIVSQSRGLVSVESEPGQGTTFRVFLPEAARTGKAGEPDAETADIGPPTILLVEEDPAVRGLLRQVLELEGYKVLAASSGPEAVRASREHGRPIRMLISDTFRSGRTGRSLEEEIGRDHPGIRALFMSRSAPGPSRGEEAPKEGAERIEKPFSPSEFVERVRMLLGA